MVVHQIPGGSSSSTSLQQLSFPPAPAEEDQWWQSDNITPNSTPPLMSDEANCGNGLLLFGSDKYCDKRSALIIPGVFAPECHRRLTLNMPAELDKLIKGDFPHSPLINNTTAIKRSRWNIVRLVLTRLTSWSNAFRMS